MGLKQKSNKDNTGFKQTTSNTFALKQQNKRDVFENNMLQDMPVENNITTKASANTVIVVSVLSGLLHMGVLIKLRSSRLSPSIS